MNSLMKKWLIVGFAFFGPCLSGDAGEKALKPSFAKLGEVVASDSFDGAELGKTWSVAKGDWTIVDGAIRGAEKASDKHAAVLTYAMPNTDSVVEFRFKLEGTEGFSFSLNHAKGHLLRVTVGMEGISLDKDKDKKDPLSKMVRMSEAEGAFEQGKWYLMLVEIKGDAVVAQTSNGLKVMGVHEDFATEKTGYRFVMHGEHLLIDDVKVWTVGG